MNFGEKFSINSSISSDSLANLCPFLRASLMKKLDRNCETSMVGRECGKFVFFSALREKVHESSRRKLKAHHS